MTDLRLPGNQGISMRSPAGNALETAASPSRVSVPDFDAVYESQVDFVWRAVRRMGVRLGDMDDVVQEVFGVWPSSRAGRSSRPGCSRSWCMW
jgi:hypothetical protein